MKGNENGNNRANAPITDSQAIFSKQHPFVTILPMIGFTQFLVYDASYVRVFLIFSNSFSWITYILLHMRQSLTTHASFDRLGSNNEDNQRPIIVGSSAIAISSVGAFSLFRFLENSMKAQPASRLQRNTIQAKIREKSYLTIASVGSDACKCLLSNSIEEKSTCITTMLHAAVTWKRTMTREPDTRWM